MPLTLKDVLERTSAALLRLLLHLDQHAPDLLSLSWSTDRFGPRPGIR